MRYRLPSRPASRLAAVLFFVFATMIGCGSKQEPQTAASKSKPADAPKPHPFAKFTGGVNDTNAPSTPEAANTDPSPHVVATDSGKRESPTVNRGIENSVAGQPAPRDNIGGPASRKPVQPPAAIQPPVQPAGTPARSNVGRTIHLSVGTKLPVSLPQGTTMAFTAEYRFTGGAPNGSVQYVWVIEGRGGKRVRVPLSKLKLGGKLPQFFTRALRPGDEPFSSYIEAWPISKGEQKPGAGVRVSNVVPMS